MTTKTCAMLFMGLVTIISHVSVTSAISGTATYYTVYVPSACYGYEEQGTMIAAAGDTLWNNGDACGKMYRVTCTGPPNENSPIQKKRLCKSGSVTVKIVDRCPSPGCQGTIDLSREAFSAIADINAGNILIDYTQV